MLEGWGVSNMVNCGKYGPTVIGVSLNENYISNTIFTRTDLRDFRRDHSQVNANQHVNPIVPSFHDVVVPTMPVCTKPDKSWLEACSVPEMINIPGSNPSLPSSCNVFSMGLESRMECLQVFVMFINWFILISWLTILSFMLLVQMLISAFLKSSILNRQTIMQGSKLCGTAVSAFGVSCGSELTIPHLSLLLHHQGLCPDRWAAWQLQGDCPTFQQNLIWPCKEPIAFPNLTPLFILQRPTEFSDPGRLDNDGFGSHEW